MNFILRNDRGKRLKFCALQSGKAKEILGETKAAEQSSIILLHDGKLYRKSSAALHIAKQMKFPASLFTIFFIIPKGIRDVLYDFVARNRYRWFGRTANCRVPSPEEKERFIV